VKVLIETTGKFMLLDPVTLEEIHSRRPTVASKTSFIEQRINMGHISLLKADLPDSASDAEFATFWKECAGDKELAVESYLASLAGSLAEGRPIDVAVETKKGGRNRKGD